MSKFSTGCVAVIGGGSWATAIVKMLCNNAGQVHPDGRMSYGINWWVRSKETAEYIKNIITIPITFLR